MTKILWSIELIIWEYNHKMIAYDILRIFLKSTNAVRSIVVQEDEGCQDIYFAFTGFQKIFTPPSSSKISLNPFIYSVMQKEKGL